MFKLEVVGYFLYQNGKTALHLAALNEKTDLVKMMIDAGINIEIQDKVSFTFFALLDM